MLKKRVIACLCIRDNIVVQSIQFKKYLPIGKPSIAVEFLNQWGIDEIIILDISAAKNSLYVSDKMIKEVSAKCHVPLTVGGGLKTLEQVEHLVHAGADKIAVNNEFLVNPAFVETMAHKYGNQFVIVSIDSKKNSEGKDIVFDYTKNEFTDYTPGEFAKKAEDFGAGEILINSIDNDGTYSGYDYNLINSICDAVNIPIICLGGAKNSEDFINVFTQTNVSAAAAANFFHFSEHSVNITKSDISKTIPVRLETHANYSSNPLDESKRLNKKSENFLEHLLYVKIAEEII